MDFPIKLIPLFHIERAHCPFATSCIIRFPFPTVLNIFPVSLYRDRIRGGGAENDMVSTKFKHIFGATFVTTPSVHVVPSKKQDMSSKAYDAAKWFLLLSVQA